MSMLILKRLLRLTAILFGVFALLCGLTFAGALLWLRTSMAERVLTDLAVQALDGQGMTLTIGNTAGPLPHRLLLRDIQLADSTGVFLHADELEVALSLRQLFAKTLVVDSLRLSGPELFRLPVLPAKVEDTSASNAPAPDLPVGIRLDSLRVENALLHGKVLALPPDFLSGSLPDPLVMNAEGTASFENGVLTSRLEVSSPLDSDDGLGLAVRVSGNLNLVNGGMQSDFELTAADNARWQLLLARALGLAPDIRPGGSLNLSGHVALPAPDKLRTDKFVLGEFISGNLVLQGQELRWPPTFPAQALGDTLTLKAGFSGGLTGPGTLTLETLDLGIFHATGQAVYTAEKAGASSLSDAAPAKLETKLTVDISDLAPLEKGVAGPLTLNVTANGPLNALQALVTASSSELILPAGALHEAAVKVSGDIRRQTGGALTAAGLVEASVAQAFGEPVEFSTAWEVAVAGNPSADASGSISGETPGGSHISAALSQLRAQGAGVTLSGDLSGRLNAESALPALDGALVAEVRDWPHLSSLLGTPLSGEQARVDLRLDNSGGRQQASLGLQLASLRLPAQGQKDVFAAQNIAGTLDIQDAFHEQAAQLRLNLGQGNAGPLTWATGTASLDGNVRDGTFSLQLRERAGRSGQVGTQQAVATGKQGSSGRNASGNASGTAAKRKAGSRAAAAVASGSGSGTDTLALRGSYDVSKKEITLTQALVEVPQTQAGLRLRKPLVLSFGNGIQVRGLNAAISPSGSLVADASISPESMTVDATLSELPFTFFKMFTDSALPVGVIDAHAVLSTTSRGPQGTITLNTQMGLPEDKTQPSAQFAVKKALSMQVEAVLGPAAASGGLALRGNGKLGVGKEEGANRGDLSFAVPLRMAENGLPLPNTGAPLTAAVHWNGPADLLWQIAAIPDRFLTGRALLEVAVSGSMDSPRIDVEAFLADGRYEDRVLGVLLEDIALEARATPDGAVRAVLALDDGENGTLALEGRVFKDSSPNGGGDPAVALRGQIRHLQPIHRDDLSIMFSGLLGINGPLAAPAITANVIVERGEVTLLSTMGGGSVQTLSISEKGDQARDHGGGPSCAVTIDIPGRFFIRGRGLDSEWEGQLRLNGPLSEPALTGSLRPVRGFFSLLSRSFDFTGGSITFFGGRPIVPGIDLELTYNGPNIEAIVTVGGTSARPSLTLGSRPPLPQDEVLAHVLFGKSVSSLSRFEALQLANSMRELAGVGDSGFNPLTTMRRTLGLDVLRVGGGGGGDQARRDSGQSGASDIPRPGGAATTQSSADQAPTLEAGKYINDSIYIGVEQGATQESTGVRVEIELFPNVTLEGRTSPSSSQAGIGWKRDY